MSKLSVVKLLFILASVSALSSVTFAQEKTTYEILEDAKVFCDFNGKESNLLPSEGVELGVALDGALGNPAFVDYAGFPPILLLMGTAEIFYPATEEIVERIKESGVEFACNRGEGLMHDWALVNYFPEGAAAQCQIKRFILER